MISTVSPRTRNVPRVKARSLRVYCICDELAQQLVAVDLVADPEPDHPVDVLLRRAQAVDAGHRGDDDDVAPGQQRVGRAVPQPLDLVVDRGVLLDVGVRLRDVRLGLVVVVVGDEVLDGVVGQQLAELVGELGGQGLVGRHDQRRPLHLLDQPGRRRGLAGAGGAEQDDVLLPRLDPRGELVDRRRLVARGRELGDHLERGDRALQVGRGTHGTTVCRRTDRGGAPYRESCPPRSPARWGGRDEEGRKGGRGAQQVAGGLLGSPASGSGSRACGACGSSARRG